MSHPPIPPNCPYFRKVKGKWIFSAGPITRIPLDVDARTPKYKIEERREWVPIIAAVAAEAWIEEFNRMWKERYDPNKDEIEAADELEDAAANIDAWRAWGKESQR